jgi:hypothetical protein
MNTRKQYKKSPPPSPMYVVINREGEVFTGLCRGYTQWSGNWLEAKPLYKENTTRLLEENIGAEIIKEEELLK